MFFQALESSSTWVVEFCDEEEKVTWLKGLIQATYQASVCSKIFFFFFITVCIIHPLGAYY